MYRDDMEALRARINTLEAQLVAERRGREAAEASAFASRAALEEQQRFKENADAISPAHALRAWPLAMVVVFSTVSCLFLGMQWSHQWHRGERLERMLVLSHHQTHPTLRAPRGAVSQRSWVPEPVRVQPTIVPSPSVSPSSAPARVLPKVAPPPSHSSAGLAPFVAREQRRTREALKTCFNSELLRQSGEEGERLFRLELHVDLRADGTVSKAKVKVKGRSKVKAREAMTRCVEKVAKTWRFPAARDAAPRTLVCPLVFRSVAVH